MTTNVTERMVYVGCSFWVGIRCLIWTLKSKKNFSKMPRYRRTTARCALHMSALKIVCKRKISRRLRKNRHITILSLFGGEIIFEVFPSNVVRVAKRYRQRQTETDDILWHHRVVKLGRQNVGDIIGIADI